MHAFAGSDAAAYVKLHHADVLREHPSLSRPGMIRRVNPEVAVPVDYRTATLPSGMIRTALALERVRPFFRTLARSTANGVEILGATTTRTCPLTHMIVRPTSHKSALRPRARDHGGNKERGS
jgi:hypothetical protein